jgi:23S rRNA pseudouridine1911/1915/1917 synthase
VVGDCVYGHKHATIPMNRHFLHAIRLTIILPGEINPRTFEAPLPMELVKVIERLKLER